MSALSVFIIFFLCLIIAIPISIGLGIVSVLPGIFDSSFTASGQFVIRYAWGNRQFSAAGGADVCIIRHGDGKGRNFKKDF